LDIAAIFMKNQDRVYGQMFLGVEKLGVFGDTGFLGLGVKSGAFRQV
jgi:hypothetical protein